MRAAANATANINARSSGSTMSIQTPGSAMAIGADSRTTAPNAHNNQTPRA
jgi:hypothetical protein